jgi:polyhydroxyalkanoate synthesis regulator phasin
MSESLSLVARIRSRMDLVPATMRGAVERALERVRHVLHVPSRAEMADLTQRLESLDRKIAELAAHRARPES